MISKSNVSSYRKYLTDRISELTEAHTKYKEAENNPEISEQLALAHNSQAASIWDMKTEAESALQVFNFEFDAIAKPYKLLNMAIGPYTTPKITIKIGNEETTFELEKITGEPGEVTMDRLIAKADKYYEFNIQEEEAVREEMEKLSGGVYQVTKIGNLTVDDEPLHPSDTVAWAFPDESPEKTYEETNSPASIGYQ